MSIRVETFDDVGVTVVSRWIFNCYVVHDGGDGRPFLVDAGLPSTTQRALRFVADNLGHDPADVSAIVSTHAHSDHVAGVADAVGLSGAPVYLPAKVRDYFAGEEARSPGPRAVAKIWPVALDQPFDARSLAELAKVADEGFGRTPMSLSVDVSGYLADGDTLPGAPDWRVVAGPGHTDDSTVFHNPTTGALLSGDTILSAEGRAWFNPEFVDQAASAATEERLRNLDIEHLFPGHGRVVCGNDVLGGARSHRDAGLVDGSTGRAFLRWLRSG